MVDYRLPGRIGQKPCAGGAEMRGSGRSHRAEPGDASGICGSVPGNRPDCAAGRDRLRRHCAGGCSGRISGGPVELIKAVPPGMRARRSGTVINVSSIAALRTSPGSGYYADSKSALESLSDGLRIEVAPLGIRVLVVAPGAFRTEFAGRSLTQSATAIADYEGTAGARSPITGICPISLSRPTPLPARRPTGSATLWSTRAASR